eukprot:516607_1
MIQHSIQHSIQHKRSTKKKYKHYQPLNELYWDNFEFRTQSRQHTDDNQCRNIDVEVSVSHHDDNIASNHFHDVKQVLVHKPELGENKQHEEAEDAKGRSNFIQQTETKIADKKSYIKKGRSTKNVAEKQNGFSVSGLVLKGVLPLSEISALYDVLTDLQLIYKMQQNKNLWWVLAVMLISVLSPYLVAYSCGAKLYLNRGIFDKFSTGPNYKKILLLIYLLPAGAFYYIFLDIYFISTKLLYLWPSSLCFLFCKKKEKTDENKTKIAKLVNMSLMDYEGYSKLRSITQLMLESIPQVFLQTLMFFNLIDITGTTVTNLDVIKSLIPAILNVFITLTLLFIESRGFEEPWISYALTSITG